MKQDINAQALQTLTHGKYLISPLTKQQGDGSYACSVSIRSGSGTGTTDRVVRLTQRFRDRQAAAVYAVEQGLEWMGLTRPAAPPLRMA